MATPRFLSTGLPSPPSPRSSEDPWGLEPLSGRLVEISSHRAAAGLTAAFGLVLEAQEKAEPAAWVTLKQSTFFPPDVADSGVDLSQLAVVRVEDLHAAYRATVELTRSAGFGLVVLDLGPEIFQKAGPLPRRGRYSQYSKNLSVPFVTKLVGLAQKTSTAVVVLTEKTRESSSLSSLVSLRLEAQRAASKPGGPFEPLEPFEPFEPFEIELFVLKDKRRGPGRRYREVCRAPAGLR